MNVAYALLEMQGGLHVDLRGEFWCVHTPRRRLNSSPGQEAGEVLQAEHIKRQGNELM